MNKLLGKIARVGIVTETFKPLTDPELDRLGTELKAVIDGRFAGSLAIRQVDAGSCNACELEIAALGNPFYDIERYGVHFVASPRHADVLMVTGPVSRHMQAALQATWEATPEPKWVVAVGSCAADGGEFGVNYASCGAVGNVLPVDAVIPGCPPTPTDLVRGLLSLISR
ncbi:NADH-quinone oxidoreductase subunit B family protein [Methylococcus capsulatus]|uniref:NADH-quinone oxidoreductase subunit B family protein n=1 Tax=Methylococcus capsulatus TaxID=414 RepID=UPI0002E591B2|nr:NADH-quinone oxidoreductase subunit NuoB [Methylococcus capsulatus]QXP90512.1 NADH-quinone oxidoreductase subunit NuoB [Methylococcus capsulatus]